MQENIILDDELTTEDYNVIVTGIKWNKDSVGKYRSKKDFSNKLPEQTVIVLPESVTKHENTDNFYDIVESFVYTHLMKRYNHIANYCQIWLPLEK
jgi:hypothetical protein